MIQFENLIALRKLKGMNQSDLAEELGITLRTYHNKETGKTDFTLSEAKKISDVFSMKVEDIFFEPLRFN